MSAYNDNMVCGYYYDWRMIPIYIIVVMAGELYWWRWLFDIVLMTMTKPNNIQPVAVKRLFSNIIPYSSDLIVLIFLEFVVGTFTYSVGSNPTWQLWPWLWATVLLLLFIVRYCITNILTYYSGNLLFPVLVMAIGGIEPGYYSPLS